MCCRIRPGQAWTDPRRRESRSGHPGPPKRRIGPIHAKSGSVSLRNLRVPLRKSDAPRLLPTIALLVAQWHRGRSRGHLATCPDISGRRKVKVRVFPPEGWLHLLPLSANCSSLAPALTVHDTFSSHVRSVRTSSTHQIHHGGTLGRFMASFRRHRLSDPPPRVTRLSGGPRWCPVARICAIRELNRPGSRSWVL